MKKLLIISIAICLLFIPATGAVVISEPSEGSGGSYGVAVPLPAICTNLGFETGDLTGWTVISGGSNAKVATCASDNVQPHEGSRLYETAAESSCTSGASGTEDQRTSEIKSDTFTLPQNTNEFRAWITAGRSSNLKLNLYLASDNSLLADFNGADNPTWYLRTQNVANYAGQEVYMKIIDTDTGGWGHIVVDDIHFVDSAGNRLSCGEAPPTAPISGEFNCRDGIDNDEDELVDCMDEDCADVCELQDELTDLQEQVQGLSERADEADSLLDKIISFIKKLPRGLSKLFEE